MHVLTTIDAPLSDDGLIDLHYLLEADELFVQLPVDSLLTEDVR